MLNILFTMKQFFGNMNGKLESKSHIHINPSGDIINKLFAHLLNFISTWPLWFSFCFFIVGCTVLGCTFAIVFSKVCGYKKDVSTYRNNKVNSNKRKINS